MGTYWPDAGRLLLSYPSRHLSVNFALPVLPPLPARAAPAWPPQFPATAAPAPRRRGRQPPAACRTPHTWLRPARSSSPPHAASSTSPARRRCPSLSAERRPRRSPPLLPPRRTAHPPTAAGNIPAAP